LDEQWQIGFGVIFLILRFLAAMRGRRLRGRSGAGGKARGGTLCRTLGRRLTEQNSASGVHDWPAWLFGHGGRFSRSTNFGKGPRMSKLILVFAFVCTGLSSASAQGGHPGTPQEQQACSRDASRFCRKQLGDDAAVQQCLQQNRQKLSSPCQKVFQSHGQ
jgi:hypothetical protein